MKRIALLALLLSVGVLVSVQAKRSNSAQGGELPALPVKPQTSLIELIEAHPFTLAEPETHWMRSEHEQYTTGTLLVLRALPELWTPRQTFENVLYVGSETAEPVNVGATSGFRIVIVPGKLDLAAAEIFLGEPQLPERITRAEARRQQQLARALGVPALGKQVVEQATRQAFAFRDGYELRRFAADLIQVYSPDETDVVAGLRAERL